MLSMSSTNTQTLSFVRTTSRPSIMSTSKSTKPTRTPKPLPVTGRRGKEKDRINNIALPHFIRCSICSMDRPVEAYSNAQLKQLRTQIHNNGGKASDSLSTAKCEDCTLDPSEQRKCQSCGESKALSEFSKAQRFGGELRCVQCIDFYQRFERRNDGQKLLEGPQPLLAIEMNQIEEEGAVSMVPIAAPSAQTMMTSSDQNTLTVRRPAVADRTGLVHTHVNPSHELSPSDSVAEEMGVDMTAFL